MGSVFERGKAKQNLPKRLDYGHDEFSQMQTRFQVVCLHTKNPMRIVPTNRNDFGKKKPE